MLVAVYRYVPTREFYQINGQTYERQEKEWMETVRAQSPIEVAKQYEIDDYVLTFEEVKDA
jgi:hypothetical protein